MISICHGCHAFAGEVKGLHQDECWGLPTIERLPSNANIPIIMQIFILVI